MSLIIVASVAPMMTAAGAALAFAGGWRITVENTEPEVVPGDAEENGH